MTPERPDRSTEISDGLDAIFERNRDDFGERTATLEAAVAAIIAGDLDEQLRTVAGRDAHKLAGSLGTFGLVRGSELARELELLFNRSPQPVDLDAEHLLGVVGALRRELDGKERRAEPETGLAVTAPAALGSPRILVVDDDPPVRRALAMMLTDAGYDVQDVGNAAQARHELARGAFDLLLSDVRMPRETGIELIRFALCEHPGTATLLISALEDPEIAQVAIDYGAYGYLSKPVRRTEVLIGVMNALRRRDIEMRERATRENLEHIVALRTGALSDALERVEAAATRGRALRAETIHRWAQSAEHRDRGIARHVKRVGHYCAVLGQAFGLRAESLSLASVLHDVGKLAIPDSIVLKPGPLTAAECLVMETHAAVGHEMLCGSSNSLLDLAAVIARTHHEKFDGSGYPRSIAGHEIPLEGRIAAVADVFDALTCDRVYRPAWSVESAVAWMVGERESTSTRTSSTPSWPRSTRSMPSSGFSPMPDVRMAFMRRAAPARRPPAPPVRSHSAAVAR